MKRVMIYLVLISLLASGFSFCVTWPAQAQSAATDTPIPSDTSTPASATPANTALPPSATPTASATFVYASPTIAPIANTAAPAATAIPATATQGNQTYQRPLLNMSSSSYDARQAYVGGVFTLNTVFANQGQKTAYNIIITFASNDLQARSNGGVSTVSSLDAGSDITVTQNFLIKNSINTYQSAIDVSVEYKDANGASYTQKFTVGVSVYWATKASATPTATPIGRPHVVIGTYSVDKPILQPGSNFTLTLNIQNQGVFKAFNTSLTLGGSGGGTSGSTTSSNFLPVGSSNTRVLGDMEAKQEMQIQQAFVVNSSTTPGAIPLTITFGYKDGNGQTITDDQVITLLVYLVPSIEISYYTEPETFTVGKKGTLPIQVVNLSGSSILLGDISVSMESATLGNSQMFIGTLDGGGSFTLDTDMTPKKSGDQKVKISIAYQDNFKNPQSISQTLAITVGGTSSAGNGQAQTTQTANGQFPNANFPNGSFTNGGSAASTTQTVWQIILRVIRGLIGFDSAPDRTVLQPFTGGMPSFGATATPRP